MSGDDDRYEPMNFYSLTDDYYQSAVCLLQEQEAGNLRTNFRILVPNYLLAHSMELALKGFLRANGVSKEDLKYKYVHKFGNILKDSTDLDLNLTETEREIAAAPLDLFDKEGINFRYFVGVLCGPNPDRRHRTSG